MTINKIEKIIAVTTPADFFGISIEINKIIADIDKTEKAVYRKRTMFVLFIEIITFLISLFIFNNWIAETVALGMFTESLLVIIGVIRRHNN